MGEGTMVGVMGGGRKKKKSKKIRGKKKKRRKAVEKYQFWAPGSAARTLPAPGLLYKEMLFLFQ